MINNWIHLAGYIWECPHCKKQTVLGDGLDSRKAHKFCGWCGKQNIIFEDEQPVIWNYDIAPTSYKPCPICGYNRGKWLYNGGYHVRTIRRECKQCGFAMTVDRKNEDSRIHNIGDPQLRTCWNYIHTLEYKDKGKFTIPWVIRRSNGKSETYNLEVSYEKNSSGT